MKNHYDSKGTYAHPQTTAFVSLKAYQDHLVESHLYLVDRLAKSFMNKFESNNRLCDGDMHSVGYEALVRASRTYNPFNDRTFKSYAWTVIENAMKCELRDLFPVDLKTSWQKDSFNYSETFDDKALTDNSSDKRSNWLCNWDDDQKDLLEALALAFNRLNPQDRSLIEDRYGFNSEEMKLIDLGDKHHVSHQAVDKKLHRILNKLHELLNTGSYTYRRCA